MGPRTGLDFVQKRRVSGLLEVELHCSAIQAMPIKLS
jgi:hypothetical protein